MLVNMPILGKITELLVNEEDMVTVGQDLFCFVAGKVNKSSASAATSSEAAPQAEKVDVVKPKAGSPTQEPLPPPIPVQGKSKAKIKETSKPAPVLKEESRQSTTPSVLASFATARGLLQNKNWVKMSRM